MSNFQTVKNKFRNFVTENISELLTADKVFFATERFTMPEKPYIMITELSNNEDLGSGRNEPKNKTLEITEYKETIFTVAIYGLRYFKNFSSFILNKTFENCKNTSFTNSSTSSFLLTYFVITNPINFP